MRNDDDGWMMLWSGRKFWPLDPHPDDFTIDDIAHSLARLCRYNGHIDAEFYSVAQHSVLVSRIVPVEYAFEGLMHDAEEFVTNDLCRPVKYAIPEFRNLGDLIWAVIAKKFNLPIVHSPAIKIADNIILASERRDFQPNFKHAHKGFYPIKDKIAPLMPSAAENLFLERFHELKPTK